MTLLLYDQIFRSKRRNQDKSSTKWAVQPDDLIQSLNQHQPTIVHISGHGSKAAEIVLVDRDGGPKPVSQQAIVALFKALKGKIRVVVLNACFSRPQAEAIVQEIDFAIGMSRDVSDGAAVTFAASFYRALGFRASVQHAFDQAKAALKLEGIPEEGTPQLLVRHGLEASQAFLVNGR